MSLATGRLRLRPTAAADADALLAHWREPAVRHYLWDDIIIGPEAVDAVVQQSLLDQEEFGWGGWTVRVPGDGIIGWCGLRRLPLDASVVTELDRNDVSVVELIYSLSSAWWGRGMAVEASTAVLDQVFGIGLLDEIWAGHDAPNVRSAATIKRLGFSFVRDLLLDTGPTPYWKITRAEWVARPGPN